MHMDADTHTHTHTHACATPLLESISALLPAIRPSSPSSPRPSRAQSSPVQSSTDRPIARTRSSVHCRCACCTSATGRDTEAHTSDMHRSRVKTVRRAPPSGATEDAASPLAAPEMDPMIALAHSLLPHGGMALDYGEALHNPPERGSLRAAQRRGDRDLAAATSRSSVVAAAARSAAASHPAHTSVGKRALHAARGNPIAKSTTTQEMPTPHPHPHPHHQHQHATRRRGTHSSPAHTPLSAPLATPPPSSIAALTVPHAAPIQPAQVPLVDVRSVVKAGFVLDSAEDATTVTAPPSALPPAALDHTTATAPAPTHVPPAKTRMSAREHLPPPPPPLPPPPPEPTARGVKPVQPAPKPLLPAAVKTAQTTKPTPHAVKPVQTPVKRLASQGTGADNPILLDDDDGTPTQSQRQFSQSRGNGYAASAQRQKSVFHLIFPPDGRDQVLITDSDLLLLKPGEFLNDSIVDFYLKWIMQQLSAQLHHRIYCFNSFFYKKWLLVEEAEEAATMHKSRSKTKSAAAAAAATAPRPSKAYEAVARWTKGVNIFEKDFIIVPINDTLHWSLAIICYPRKFFTDRPIEGRKQPKTSTKRTAASVTNSILSQVKSGIHSGISGLTRLLSGAKPHHDEEEEEEDPYACMAPPAKKQRSDASETEHKAPERPRHMDATNEHDDTTSPPAASVMPRAADDDPTHLPAILYFDSLLPPPSRLYQQLSTWLKEEWRAKYPDAPHRWQQPPYFGGIRGQRPGGNKPPSDDYSPFSSRGDQVHYESDDPLYVLFVPEQKNGCDCGLYLLEYTELFTNGGAGPAQLSEHIRRLLALHHGGDSALAQSAAIAAAKKNGRNPNIFENVFANGRWRTFPQNNMNKKRQRILGILHKEHEAQLAREAEAIRLKENARQINKYKAMLIGPSDTAPATPTTMSLAPAVTRASSSGLSRAPSESTCASAEEVIIPDSQPLSQEESDDEEVVHANANADSDGIDDATDTRVPSLSPHL